MAGICVAQVLLVSNVAQNTVMTKARARAQLRLLQDRMAQTEAFLDRSRKKMEAVSAEVFRLQEVMAELTIKIQDGTSRLEGLKEPSPFSVPTDPQEEIRLLRARIAQMEGSMEGDVQEAKRGRPTCEATLVGNEVARLCCFMGTAATSFSDAFGGVQCSPMSDVQIPDLVPRVHQCGFQGCRVGEASNPGRKAVPSVP